MMVPMRGYNMFLLRNKKNYLPRLIGVFADHIELAYIFS